MNRQSALILIGIVLLVVGVLSLRYFRTSTVLREDTQLLFGSHDNADSLYLNQEYGFRVQYPKHMGYKEIKSTTTKSELMSVYFAEKPVQDDSVYEYLVEIKANTLEEEIESKKNYPNFHDVNTTKGKVGEHVYTLISWKAPSLPGSVDFENRQEIVFERSGMLYILTIPNFSSFGSWVEALNKFSFE